MSTCKSGCSKAGTGEADSVRNCSVGSSITEGSENETLNCVS